MTVRLALRDPLWTQERPIPQDYADIVACWNDSQPTISARSVAAGGPQIDPWTAGHAHAYLSLPGQRAWIVDTASDVRAAGFLMAQLSPAGFDGIVLAVRHVKVGTPAQRLALTRLRLRKVMLEGLAAMASSVPAATPIRARYPHFPNATDTDAPSSVLTFLDEMATRNGVAHDLRNGHREYPPSRLTAGKVLQGLAGIVA